VGGFDKNIGENGVNVGDDVSFLGFFRGKVG